MKYCKQSNFIHIIHLLVIVIVIAAQRRCSIKIKNLKLINRQSRPPIYETKVLRREIMKVSALTITKSLDVLFHS